MATIRHRKDAWYVLENGDFERARFMSCMGTMHWDSIDFLPVVELFKSLLPGTGSAGFELIRGLYDDQNQGKPSPLPLRYRGIPAYPSEAAFRLFQSCFVPHAPPGKDALSLFMDPAKAHQVEWLPSPHPPRRCFDDSTGSCLTIQGAVLQKVTRAHDSAGLAYMNPKGRAFLVCDRAALVIDGRIILKERDEETILTTAFPSGCCEDSPSRAAPTSPVDWRSIFVEGLPPIPPHKAYGAVLLYPEDETPIGELATQPFVAEYLQDIAEQDPRIGSVLARAEQVLIHNGDAVIATCVSFDRPREYTVTVQEPAFAQKQAQQLWTTCAQLQRWDWLTHIRCVPVESQRSTPSSQAFDVIYYWMPFLAADDPVQLETAVKDLCRRLRPGGHAFVTGPASLSAYWPEARFRVEWQEVVDQLPTFRMHRTILPQSRLKAGLTLYHVTAL
jgi:hypothetical protein